ncbi:MAG: transcription termination factor NusA [Alphaproteobacteria bacterium]|nr:transcription termination factor NusA [Alphaproteobacteria bacterium]
MGLTATLPRPELLQIAEVVAREKGIEKDDVLTAMEQAIQRAGRSKYGTEYDIRATIDRKTGEISLARYIEIVDEVENESIQISLADARKDNSFAKLGDFIIDPLPPIEFGRIAAQIAKQVIVQKIRDSEREHQFEDYKDKVGQIVNGIVKRVEMGNVVVDLGKAEAILRRDEMIPRETFRVGDRVRAYLLDVRQENRGPQIFLTRSHPQFLAKLFTQEVPEIYDGIIEIKNVVRDAGSRSKIAVISKDNTIDPRGACIGLRGVRVQAIVAELQGEKIDIVQWSPDVATFIVNALYPTEVTKIVLDEETNNAEVIVPDEELSQAIGRRGQNVRLVSQLTGWHIDIMNEKEEVEQRQIETKEKVDLFIKALDVDDMIAHLLVQEGFSTLQEIAYVEKDELLSIEGFDEGIVEELQKRAENYLVKKDEENEKKIKEFDLKDDLKSFEDLTQDQLVLLGEKGIKTLDDFADLSSEELIEIFGEDFPEDEANILIMKAREHWFEDENV